MNKELSIIIPYYETYDLTYKLLKELEKQVNDKVEIILVDDGCNETRLDEFSHFVNITHLDKNYGASHAWNVGLDQAVGRYIGFIDSDDFISEDYIEVLLDAIDRDLADEIVFNFYLIPSNTLMKKPHCRAIWKAVYTHWLVPRFDESRKFHTDLPFSKHMKNTDHSVYYLDNNLYYYNSIREGSITWKARNGLFKKEEKND